MVGQIKIKWYIARGRITKMPVVDGKHYPYTDKGMVAALAAAGKKKKKKKKGK